MARSRTNANNHPIADVAFRPEVIVVQSGVVEIPRRLPGGGVTHQYIMTSLDDQGKKWVNLRDVCLACGVEPPTRVAPDDIIYPVWFSECDAVRAGVSLPMLNEFFNRIGYNRRNRFAILEAVRSFWISWFSREGRSVHIMHEAYTYLLNTTVEPALEAFIETYEFADRQERPEGLTSIVLYEASYIRLLRCIGQDVHVDFEDLTPAELSRLMSVMTTFSMMVLSAVAGGINKEDHDDPIRLLSIIINQLHNSLYAYNGIASVVEEVVEECYDWYSGTSEITYTT